MSKEFNVYKWRRNNLLTEDVANSTRADYIYTAIKEYLAPNYQDQSSANSIKRQIMYGLIDADRAGSKETTIDRSEMPLQESELRGSWVDKKGTFNGKAYDGYFKTTQRDAKLEDVKNALEKLKATGKIDNVKYTYVDDEEWDDDDRKTEYWYYYKK
jgi:hypothetical protein